MKTYKLLLGILFLSSLWACNNKAKNKIDVSFIKSYYKIMEVYNAENYDDVLFKADSCLNIIDADTSLYYIGLNMVIGQTYIQKKDTLNSKKYFTEALIFINQRILLTALNRDINDIMNKAYILCFLGRKQEAIVYIKTINFKKEELKCFGNSTPLSLIESY
ncbi:MAG: hypothetical protein IMY73_02880 [Bacteroidetes bacterium]|nr:hypothetical protein [Bacteroidota bacterium]